MIRETKSPGRNRRSGDNVIYSESFTADRGPYVSGSAAPDDFWSERSMEEVHKSNKDIRLLACDC